MAQRWHAHSEEHAPHAEFQLVFLTQESGLAQASGAVELQGLIDTQPPFGFSARSPNNLGLVCDNPAMSGQPRGFCFALALFSAGVAGAQDAGEILRQGRQLDLIGEYGQARQLFAKLLEVASSPQTKAQAQRSMAVSYAFEGDCKNAVKYEGPLYETYLASKSFFDAGETADELARICIDSGDLDQALEWYQKGHAAGLNEPEEKQKDLWNFRWEHAQARIAARRGNQAEARKHVEAAKAILDQGSNPQQAPFFPYLAGYVAFYDADYKTALAEFQKANQSDPFIQVMIAQTYEKLGDQAHASEYYHKALASNAHNPPNAFAHPLAKKKTGT
jgi:tetratricopeptide (TPR) repeat protein